MEQNHSDTARWCQSRPVRLMVSLLIAVSVLAGFSSAADSGSLVITAAGDIMLSGQCEAYLREKNLGYRYPFEKVLPILREGAVGIANLEGPVTDTGERYEDKTFTFKMETAALDAVAGAGFSVFSLANNHILDYGPTGLRNTLAALRDRGLAGAGAGMTITEARAPAVITVKGVRIAFLSYSATYPEEFYAGDAAPGTAFPREEFLDQDIPAAKKSADLVIVAFHWGQELMDTPKDYQVALARRAIDRGAGIVLGHHPHVLQGVEVYRGGMIFYSLGNFAFGSYSRKVRDSAIVLIHTAGGLPLSASVVPVDVYNPEVLFQPTPLSGTRAAAVLTRLQELSESRGTEVAIVGNRGWIFIGQE